MSETATIDTSEEFLARAIPLLKEYTGKLQEFKGQLRRLRRDTESSTASESDAKRVYQAEYGSLYDYHGRMKPAVKRFAQQVSGMIDQGDISPLEKVELQLRLAELESELDSLPELMRAYVPK
jgi:hypothetical protein